MKQNNYEVSNIFHWIERVFVIFKMGCQVSRQSWNLQALPRSSNVSDPPERYFINSYDLVWSFFQVSYAIGVAEPLSISVFDYGTSDKTPTELMDIVQKNFDLRPGIIVK